MRKYGRGSLLILAALLLACLWAVPGQAEDARVDAYLAAQAEAQSDPWIAAILGAGAREVSWAGDTATFYLRSYNPGIKALGTYAKAADQAAWRQKALENLAAWNLKAEVRFEADGSVSKKQTTALINTVKKAASTAKSALGGKDWEAAMTDMLYCAPTAAKTVTADLLLNPEEAFTVFIAAHGDTFPGEDAAAWAPLLYLQRAWKYTVTQGPHSVKMTWDAAEPAQFLAQAYDNLSAALAGKTAAERASAEKLPEMWRQALAETAVTLKKGKLVSQSITIDLDDLIAGGMPESYGDYFAAYTPETWYNQLVEGYEKLPEAAAQAMPKSGVITQAKKGRAVTVKVAKDGRNTYVQLRDAETGVIKADAFVTPGNSVNMKVPEGSFVVQYATGSTWYGLEETFGALGNYTASNDFIVAKKKWILTAGKEQEGITLHEITAADMAAVTDETVLIQGVLAATVPIADSYPENNPVIREISSTTGLPVSDETYTPVVMVLDNAEEAYPHWGVSEADILFQVPNAGAGATKLLALFADHYPEQAGPVRSGRVSMLPVAMSFDAAFAFAGPPAVQGGQVDLYEMMLEFGMSRSGRVFDLLNAGGYAERIQGIGSHNSSCHVAAIHQTLVEKQVEFEERPFLFTDTAREQGEVANLVRVLHRGEDPNGNSNSASRAEFKYNQEAGGYTRDNSSGTYIDRNTGETLIFANVIVLRVQFSYEKNYIYLNRHMVGSGTAEIFQNGRYVRGAWVREDVYGRLVLVDADGSELQLQRGKTFIVVTNDVSEVYYSK